jgi:hypothetical protein
LVFCELKIILLQLEKVVSKIVIFELDIGIFHGTEPKNAMHSLSRYNKQNIYIILKRKSIIIELFCFPIFAQNVEVL